MSRVRRGAVGQSLGLMGNVALTFEGSVAKAAGRFGIIGQFVEGFLDLLFPPAEPPPPPPVMTKAEMTEALNNLEKEVAHQLWWQEIKQIKADVDAFNISLQDKWDFLAGLTLVKLKDDKGNEVGSLPVIDRMVDELTQKDLKVLDDYFYPTAQVDAAEKLDTWRVQLEDMNFTDRQLTEQELATRKRVTAQFYVLVGSMQASYYQASVAWCWGQELLLNSQVACYNKDLRAWQDKVDDKPGFLKKNPKEDLLDPYPELKANVAKDNRYLPHKPVTWQSWRKPGLDPVKKLQDTIDTLLVYCLKGKAATDSTPAKPGAYTELRERWDALDAAVAGWYGDTWLALTQEDEDELGELRTKRSAKSVGPLMAPHFAEWQLLQAKRTLGNKPYWFELARAMAAAPKRASDWSAAVAKYYLADTVEEDVLTFGDAIDAWRTLRASVSFHYYTTKQPLESFTTVAQDQYNDSHLADAIAKHNPDVKVGLTAPLPEGTDLKIFEKDWLPYVDLRKQLWPPPPAPQVPPASS